MNHHLSLRLVGRAGLSSLVALLLVTLLLACKPRYETSEACSEQPVFAGLQPAEIDHIRVSNRFGQLTFVKAGNEWLLQERANHPAHRARLNEMLIALSQLKVTRTTRVSESDLTHLGLTEETGTRLDLSGHGQTYSLISGNLQSAQSDSSFIFGEEHDGRRFLRHPGSQDVILASDAVAYLTTLVGHWIDSSAETPRRHQSIKFVEKGEPQWIAARGGPDEVFILTRPDGSDHYPLPGISVELDYAFTSILLKEIRTERVTPETFFELMPFGAPAYRIYLGPKIPVDENEQVYHSERTGIFRSSAQVAHRLVRFEWPEPRQTSPLPDRTYEISAPLLDEILLKYDEMRAHERLNPPSAEQ